MLTIHGVTASLSPDLDSDTIEIYVRDDGSIEARINSKTKFAEIEANRISHKHETVLTIRIKNYPTEVNDKVPISKLTRGEWIAYQWSDVTTMGDIETMVLRLNERLPNDAAQAMRDWDAVKDILRFQRRIEGD